MLLTKSIHTRGGQDIAQLSSLRRRAKAFASIIAIFSDAVDRYVVACITSLASPRTKVQKILSHFDGEVRSIAQNVLHNTSDNSNVLRKILELCYSQSLHIFSTLHFDNYLISLDKASLE